MIYEPEPIRRLRQKAKEYGVAEEEALKAWEEMKAKYNLPWYVEPALEMKEDGSVVLSPAVNINLLSRLDREVPDWERIPRPVWYPRRR
jgi:hypothetical protein